MVDIFSGSNTTGWVAESLNRHWVSIELSREYAIASSLRFMQTWDTATRCAAIADMQGGRPIDLSALSPAPSLLTVEEKPEASARIESMFQE